MLAEQAPSQTFAPALAAAARANPAPRMLASARCAMAVLHVRGDRPDLEKRKSRRPRWPPAPKALLLDDGGVVQTALHHEGRGVRERLRHGRRVADAALGHGGEAIEARLGHAGDVQCTGLN